MTKLTRRDFVRLAGAGAATAVLTACRTNAITPTLANMGETPLPATGLPQATLPPPTAVASPFTPDVEIALYAVQDTAVIFPNINTNVWRIRGELLQGDANALQAVPDSYLGPTLRLRKGQKVRIHFTNELPEESIIHWHGLHVPANMDGHPQNAVGSGQTYVYEFEVRNRAGTYWYHPHPHGRTGPQVYAGMAGFFLVSDNEEDAVNLPSGEYDIPLVLQDRRFDDNGQLVYLGNGMMDQMMGFLGDQLLVNGKPDVILPVATRAYRLRLLNGSNSRIYKLGWEDGAPFTVIGTDGGLLEKSVERPYLTLAPAERVEIWVDFKDDPLGSERRLVNLPFTTGEFQTGHFPILTVRIEREATDNAILSERLSVPGFFSTTDSERTRTVALLMQMGGWTLNGRTFEMTGVTNDETIQLNAIETWEFTNDSASGGMGMGMMNMSLPHPIHMHGESFQVLERQISASGKAAWDTVSEGFIDEGWKDTVLVMPGERVKVLRRFGDYPGLFIYHCHNLEHEDMGMMRNFEIRA
ncbi:MAG: multicopper oxidase domain-containing protein [Anaerolineales bacterium]|nr:multicopper oxidase domain-containing protein [Anaerolineales bacterium]